MRNVQGERAIKYYQLTSGEKDTGTGNSGTVVSGNFLPACGTQGTSTTKLLLEQPAVLEYGVCARHTLGCAEVQFAFICLRVQAMNQNTAHWPCTIDSKGRCCFF